MSAGELVDEEGCPFACRQIPVGGRSFAIVLCMPSVVGAAVAISFGSGTIGSGASVESYILLLANLGSPVPGFGSLIASFG